MKAVVSSVRGGGEAGEGGRCGMTRSQRGRWSGTRLFQKRTCRTLSQGRGREWRQRQGGDSGTGSLREWAGERARLGSGGTAPTLATEGSRGGEGAEGEMAKVAGAGAR